MVMALTKDGSTAPGLSCLTRLDHAWAREQDESPHHWHPPRGRHSPSLSPSPSPSPPPSDSEYWPERHRRDDSYPNDRFTDDRFTNDHFTEELNPEDQYLVVHSPQQRSRPAPLVGPAETVAPGAPFSGSWADAVRLIKQDMSEHGFVECSSEDNLPSSPLHRLERVVLNHKQREVTVERHSSCRSSTVGDGRAWGRREARDRGSGYWENGVGGRSEPRPLRHSASVRCSSTYDGWRQARPLERVGSWASSNSSDKRVHFQDNRSRPNGYRGDGRRAYEGSYEGFRERGDAVRYNGDPRPTSGRSRGHQTFSGEDDRHLQPQVTPLQRNAFARRSYHGDSRQSRQRRSFQGGRSNDYHQTFGPISHNSIPEERGGEPSEGLRERPAWERRSCRSYRERPRGRPSSPSHQMAPPHRVEQDSGARHWNSECRPAAGCQHRELEDGFCSGEEGVWERRADTHTARSHRPSDTGNPGALAQSTWPALSQPTSPDLTYSCRCCKCL